MGAGSSLRQVRLPSKLARLSALPSECVAAASVCPAKILRLVYSKKWQSERGQRLGSPDGWQSTAAPLKGHIAPEPHMVRRGSLKMPRTPSGAAAQPACCTSVNTLGPPVRMHEQTNLHLLCTHLALMSLDRQMCAPICRGSAPITALDTARGWPGPANTGFHGY